MSIASSHRDPGRTRRWIACGLAAAALGAWLPAATGEAAEPKQLGAFNSWKAFVVTDGKAKHCFVYSEPSREEGRYDRRGKVSVSISHRTQDKVRNEISFSAGYAYKPESEVEVLIDGKQRFTLFVDGEAAWAPDDATDTALRKAIEAGSTMTVKGRSSRGTLTTDTYSLSGTSAALARIDRECRT